MEGSGTAGVGLHVGIRDPALGEIGAGGRADLLDRDVGDVCVLLQRGLKGVLLPRGPVVKAKTVVEEESDIAVTAAAEPADARDGVDEHISAAGHLSTSPHIGQLFREEKFYADNKCVAIVFSR